ncbi:uncharacterized protein KY384_006556 [Bacidia gigantensis]|uniref:uncharacterized protein n=1 Tax=Bacidia gigantensis TaxID=2732470 RepID=UPI001D03EB70|nr:uncharacterized protein KY384_006556 [Bacidia gigantensis]KAG8528867.1 hypothetical protein KY384_006556 [Bacidia gigantensis]
MEKTKSVVKSGWQAKGKDGGKESWRGDFKGINQVTSKFGYGKSSSSNTPQEHVSRPLTSLKDPAAFGPPPKNVNYHGGAAVPNSITPDRRGLGAPLTEEELSASHDEEQQTQKPPPPPVPYRADRTGLRTQGLPAPPTRAQTDPSSPLETPTARSKPHLPPRLPPRQNTRPAAPSPPPPPYTETPTSTQPDYINHNLASRLGKSGISVPGFGINRSSTSPAPSQQPTAQPKPSFSPVSALNNRWPSPAPATPTPAPDPMTQAATQNPWSTTAENASGGGGTTWQQKQSALSTASKFQKDPSSISLTEAKAAAGTANNFRERHGAQVAQGWNKGQELNSKYDVAGKVGQSGLVGQRTGSGATGSASGPGGAAGEANPWAEETSGGKAGGQGVVTDGAGGGGIGGLANQATGMIGKLGKKPPPPPPVGRKPTSGGAGDGGKSAPPVPLGSKPR